MGHGPGSFDCAVSIGAAAVDRPWFFTKQFIEALLEEQQARTRRNERWSWGKVQQEQFRHLQPRIPLQKPGYPVDVAKVAPSLLSDVRSGYVTGANVPVDGGLSLTSWATDLTG
jgi:NAD(P)-dependent dehydrogenase (short-subunit alcohol dehydrogenase family)